MARAAAIDYCSCRHHERSRRCLRRWGAPVTGCQLGSISQHMTQKNGHAWERRLLFVVCVFVCLVGLLVCWFVWLVGLLGCWVVGLLGCWVVGLLGCWVVGLLVCWFVGLLVDEANCPCQHVATVSLCRSPRWQRTLRHRPTQSETSSIFDSSSAARTPRSRRHHPNLHHRHQVASLRCSKLRWRVQIESRSQ